MSKPIRETIMLVVPVRVKYDPGHRKRAVAAAKVSVGCGDVYSEYYSAVAGKPKLMKATKCPC